ncbi:glycosyl hydrolase [Caulobacter sp.]|uniref:glycosyl hydrolase n=1 Tax=Caulobacter sp. TaxID=78 RepID=UPI001B21C59D|nr:glycosyl hydrolase [Caulobacter sp.]MBO9545934.1 glycoside hydrolase [Caulobacter sp.]
MNKRPVALGLILALSVSHVALAADALRDGFAAPPAEARPQVFWQWINGNVTQEGIHLDLEWMKRAGIGGSILFDIGFGSPPIPQYVEKRIGYGSPEWKAAVRYAAAESRRLGLQFGMQAGGGWSETGGPWVKPEEAMKKLVWSETVVSGKGPITLAPPPGVSGPFQDLPITARFAEPRLYRDVAVVAWREDAAPAVAEATSSAGPVAAGKLADGAYAALAVEKVAGDGWVLLRYAAPVEARAVTVAVDGAMPNGVVEASDDGQPFRTLMKLPGEVRQGLPVRTFAFPKTTASVFRLRLAADAKPTSVTEFAIHTDPRVDRFQEKAGWGVLTDNWAAATPATDKAIAPAGVLDLTSRLKADGTLDWTPPAGRWRVVRYGWSLTGRRDTPAAAESLGLEVDKLNADHVRAHMRGVLEPLKTQLGDLYGQDGLGFVITDSWEVGQQNWTEAMAAEFQARRGYALTPWLPVLAGRVVQSAEASDRFLADYRRTIADLLTERHFAEIARILHEEGMRYDAEAPGVDLPTIADGLQAKGRVDVPMGEFWVYPEGKPPPAAHMGDVREAASAAHVYGKQLVGAEALTTMGEDPWRTGPWQHKRIVDRYMAEGINHFVLHTSAHQPFTDRKPGMTLRQYGQHLSRNETWAEGEMRTWTDYLARSGWMLRQGRPGADIAYFQGEDAATALPYVEGGWPNLPKGWDFDYVDAESLIQRMSVKDGRLVLPSGASYAALVIPARVEQISLPALRKIEALVAAGGLVVGERPKGSPTLTGGAAADTEWKSLVDKLWNGPVRTGGVEAALGSPAITGQGDSLVWTRRVLDDGELYFVANTSGQPLKIAPSFRIAGKAPELWRADTGQGEPAPFVQREGRTEVTLELAPYDAVFVVFRMQTADLARTALVGPAPVSKPLDGSWTVKFEPGWGAPASVSLPKLASWTDNADPGVRYYSGAATYEKTIEVPRAWLKGRVQLDLGEVREFATVTLNGKTLATQWKPPYAVDVTDALKPGRNTLSIRVVNFWANRMIGDLQPGAKRYTFAPIQPFKPDDALSPSGLLGPVMLKVTP